MPVPIPTGGNVLSIYDSPQRVPDGVSRPDSLAYQNNGILPVDAHCLAKVATWKAIGIDCSLYDNPRGLLARGLGYVVNYIEQNKLWDTFGWGYGLQIVAPVTTFGDPQINVGIPFPSVQGSANQASLWVWNEQTGGGVNTHWPAGFSIPIVSALAVRILSTDAFNPRNYQIWRASVSPSGIGQDLAMVSSGALQPQTPFTIPLPFDQTPLPNPNPPAFAAGPTDQIFWLGVGVTQFIAFP